MAGALVIAGMSVVSLAIGRGYYDEGYEVTAMFPTSSQGLFTDGGSDVKLRGINVGKVQGIELLDDGSARVTLFIHDGVQVPDTHGRLHRAAVGVRPEVRAPRRRATTRRSGPFLADGDEIAETRNQRELTDILASATELFDHVDPHDLVVTIDTIAEGVGGLGPEIGRTIDSSGELARRRRAPRRRHPPVPHRRGRAQRHASPTTPTTCW